MNSTGAVKKLPRKRRSLSCNTCRRLKTRCDFERSKNKCHRCFMLRLPCSLSLSDVKVKEESAGELSSAGLSLEDLPNANTNAPNSANLLSTAAVPPAAISSDSPSSQSSRLDALENTLGRMASVLENIQVSLEKLQQSRELTKKDDVIQINSSNVGLSTAGTPQIPELVQRLPLSQAFDENAPLIIIRDIDHRLFNRHSRYESVYYASNEIYNWISQRPQYANQMVSVFRQKCGGYMLMFGLADEKDGDGDIMYKLDLFNQNRFVQGGMSPLLAGVLILQGMRCDDKDTHDELQPQLFDTVRRVLSTSLMTSPLYLCDLEAMLYIAQFNVARKPKQPIFDSWLLTGYAIKLFLLSVPFGSFISRLDEGLGQGMDLYTMRLWNGLCLCHLQYALASGKPVLIPSEYLNQCSKIAAIRNRMPSDLINVGEIAMLVLLAQLQISASDGSSSNSSSYSSQQQYTGTYSELERWKSEFWNVLEIDSARSLHIGYDYCHVVLACRQLKQNPTDPKAYQVAIDRSSSIIRHFLDLSPSSIEAMPNYPLCILIYAAMTLCRFIHQSRDRHATLNLIARIYWYLYHIGNQPRDIVHSISNIIKSLVENVTQQPQYQPIIQPTTSVIDQPVAGMLPDQTGAPDQTRIPNQAEVELNSPLDGLPNMAQGPPSSASSTDAIPDISQYATYDEFFEGIYSYLHQGLSAT
ncbi:hypothetical protein TRVA0_005S01882 [Trichomonascus vanleenenianus]|uniref:uncharacterized protein n=1 Tax=Trichomonascus vanleenenianus TaxID=2268995 RepID=UPI003ECA5D54